MGKSKKTKNFLKDSSVMPTTIRFEIEENAVALMEEHLELFKPGVKAADKTTEGNSPKRLVPSRVEIDLHGLNLEDAERRVAELISRYPCTNEERTFKIITGKGRHSQAGRGVLIREIYLFVRHRYGPQIVRIEESPDAVRLGGVAIRGHFHVTLKGP